jgi:nickel-dependent lactate racemase
VPVFEIPYGAGTHCVSVPDGRFRQMLAPLLPPPDENPAALVEAALSAPYGSPPLHTLARGKRRVTVIVSDHTRPVPHKILLPPMLREIRRGNPDAGITLLVATGCHRATTPEECTALYGRDIAEAERIVVHDCGDDASLVDIGTLPSGGRLVLNRLAVDCDLLAADGFIEPHFFAGFSGGRKSVLPGVAGRESVLYNHNAEFIAHPLCRTGTLPGNPIEADMALAAERAGLAFILNVVLHGGEIAAAFAGDPERAHKTGAAYLSERARVAGREADIAVTTNGGEPLDQNLYQAVKGMTAAEAICNPGGTIVMLAKCRDGHGGEAFYREFAAAGAPAEVAERFRSRGRGETGADQWQSQILARILTNHGHAHGVGARCRYRAGYGGGRARHGHTGRGGCDNSPIERRVSYTLRISFCDRADASASSCRLNIRSRNVSARLSDMTPMTLRTAS